MKALRTLFVTICLALAACSSLPYTVTKRSEIDAQIAAARQQTTEQLAALSTKEIGVLTTKVAAIEGQRQAAADYLFRGLAVGSALKTPTRPEMVMTQSIQQTATQLPAASPKVQVETLTALQKELDEVRVSTEDLKRQYEAELGKARDEGAARAAQVTTLDAKLKEAVVEKETILTAAVKTERVLQAAKDEVQDKELAIQTAKTHSAEEDAKRAKALQGLKTKASAVVGGLMLLCIAGAIWSPVSKGRFAACAAVFGLITAGIWFIEPWMLGVVGGLGLLAILGWWAKEQHLKDRTAANTFRAIQEVKTQNPEGYKTVLHDALASWQTRYDKDGKPIPDEAAIAHVDKVLRDAGDI